MDWRLARGLEKLRTQVNAAYPKRSKSSDGSIGDANHASRSSDHNPWVTDPSGPNVVTAIDITHDPAHGFDSYAFAEMLRQNRDPRIKYIISNRKICSGKNGPSPWTWRRYTGSNPHDHHCHISILPDKKSYDDTSAWSLVGAPTADSPSTDAAADTFTPLPRTLRRGNTGDAVKKLQQALGLTGASVDGKFGAETEAKVVAFQLAKGLKPQDGIVGPQTWKALLA